MPFTPTVAIHLFAALGALAVGPVALWARRGRRQRPRLHRAFGYAWVTLMIVAAVSALFLRDTHFPNVAGFTPIHLFVALTFGGLVASFRALARRDIAAHRRIMQNLYLGACVLAGVFTLLPDRLLGRLVLVQWLGLDTPTRARWSALAGQIVSHTPVAVWALLAGLVVLGIAQARAREVGLTRAIAFPAVMTVLSAYGTASLFGRAQLLVVLAGWSAGAAAAFLSIARTAPPRGTGFDATSRTLRLPGSWIPLQLMVGLFALRYAGNVALALDPALAADSAFAAALAVLSGLFAGAFAGRAARSWRLLPAPPWPLAPVHA